MDFNFFLNLLMGLFCSDLSHCLCFGMRPGHTDFVSDMNTAGLIDTQDVILSQAWMLGKV